MDVECPEHEVGVWIHMQRCKARTDEPDPARQAALDAWVRAGGQAGAEAKGWRPKTARIES